MTLLAPAPVSVLTRVAVVGAGARGIGAAETLCTADRMCVDLLDKSPAPVGLVRYGAGPGIRLIGNVSVGRDISLAELSGAYDAVVVATSEESDQEIARAMAQALRESSYGAPGALEMLQARGVPCTIWSGPGSGSGSGSGLGRPRGARAWHRVIAGARGVPVCDQ